MAMSHKPLKETDNYLCLYKLHERYLNNMLSRYEGGLIPDFYVYFRQSWACAIFHDRFGDFMEEIKEQLSTVAVKVREGGREWREGGREERGSSREGRREGVEGGREGERGRREWRGEGGRREGARGREGGMEKAGPSLSIISNCRMRSPWWNTCKDYSTTTRT